MIRVIAKDIVVRCPNDWSDDDVEDHFEMVEDTIDKAVEGLRNALKEVHHELTVEVYE